MSTLNAPPKPRRTFSNLIRSDFWFDDGNLILIAGPAAFKVHRGQLERHSEFFNGLLSLPLPQPQSQEVTLIDGCIWVELHDRPEDVFYFLKALYDGLYFKSPQANDFSAISSVLRMSTKYLVDHLRQRCLTRLDLDWPATLSGWDHREQAATDEYGRYLPRLTCAHPVLVVRLALEQDIPSVLWAAMYDLSRYGPSKIKMGTQDLPGVCDSFFGSGSEGGEAKGRGEGEGEGEGKRLVMLSREMLFRTLKGRESAQRYMASFIAKELQNRAPSPECAHRTQTQSEAQGQGQGQAQSNDATTTATAAITTTTSRVCHESFYFIMLNVLRSVGGIASGRDADPLFTLLQAMDMMSRTDFSDGQRQCGLRICQACKADFAMAVGRAREEVWRLLPKWFGLVDE
ncbi:hypothetical protein AX17_001540 [Amanita inopinata Kibby_2008]|nr:hypothetical protein AX17_001540 [Amanita inopinata Kibby_2008]